MVLTVQRHPLNRVALQGECTERSQSIFQSPRAPERAMREETMVAYANPQTPADPMQQQTDSHGCPVGMPEGGHRSQVDT